MATTPDVFDLLTRRMDWLGQRQGLLARNVAHADTPGYLPHDLAPDSYFKRLLKGSAAMPVMATTHPEHLNGIEGRAGQAARAREQKDRYETSPVGNGVVLEEQMAAMNRTMIDYQTISNLYAKHMVLHRIALGQGGN